MHLILAAVVLVLGGATYVLLRSTQLLMFSWFHFVGAMHVIAHLRQRFNAGTYPIPKWVIYSFPDGAWVFAGQLTFCYIWRHSESKWKYLWIWAPFSASIGAEVLQGWGRVSGTYDVYDLCACAIGSLLARIIDVVLPPRSTFSLGMVYRKIDGWSGFGR